MKNFLLLFLVAVAAFFLNPAISNGQASTVVYTPRNTVVPAILFEVEPYTATQLAAMTASVTANYPQATIVAPATGKYNCHSFGWHSQSTGSNNKWLDTPSDDIYWNDGSYTFVSSANSAVKWSYVNGDHSAITYPAGQSTTFRSKWGPSPMMYHNWNYCPYNTSAMYAFQTCTASTSSCKAPGSVWSQSVTKNSATIAWTRACNAAKYQVQYKLTSSSTWNGLTVFNAPTTQHFTISRNITGMSPSTCYHFRVKVINGLAVAYSTAITVCTSAARSSGIEDPFAGALNAYSEESMMAKGSWTGSPAEQAENIFPNPSAGFATMSYQLEQDGPVSIQIYDLQGRLVVDLKEDMMAGEHETELSLADLVNGAYLVRIQSDGRVRTQKLEIAR